MYLSIENKIKDKLDELKLIDTKLSVVNEGKPNTPSIYISVGDTQKTVLNVDENYNTLIEDINLNVTLFYDFKVKSDIKNHMYNWINLIEGKIRELTQETIVLTEYTLNIISYRITNIAPRYESSMEGYLIMTINVNLQQYWG